MGRRLKASNPSKRERRKPAEVKVTFVAHPRVYQTARRIAEGDMTRVSVETPTRIVVTIP